MAAKLDAEVSPMGAPTPHQHLIHGFSEVFLFFFFFILCKNVCIYEQVCHSRTLCSFSTHETSCFQAFLIRIEQSLSRTIRKWGGREVFSALHMNNDHSFLLLTTTAELG